MAISLLMIGYAVIRHKTPPTATSAAATTSGTPTAAGSAPSTGNTTIAGAPLGASNRTEVDGIWWGWATVAADNTDQVYGIPCGWPHTIEGAAAAAMNTASSIGNVANLVDATRPTLTARLYTPDGAKDVMDAAAAAQLRAKFRLNAEGVVVLADGRVSPNEHYYGLGMPRYGAYRFITASEDFVVVEVWIPTAFGPGTDDNLSDVKLSATHASYAMRWSDGTGGKDWRVSASTPLDVKRPPVLRANIGLQRMRDLLGSGWLIPLDATDKPYPGAVWAQ